MSEYTPTTDVVRDRYGIEAGYARLIHAEDALPEFDRWLADHDAGVERAAAENAWEEGYIAASVDASNGGCVDFIEDADNPYRTGRH